MKRPPAPREDPRDRVREISPATADAATEAVIITTTTEAARATAPRAPRPPSRIPP